MKAFRGLSKRNACPCFSLLKIGSPQALLRIGWRLRLMEMEIDFFRLCHQSGTARAGSSLPDRVLT